MRPGARGNQARSVAGFVAIGTSAGHSLAAAFTAGFVSSGMSRRVLQLMIAGCLLVAAGTVRADIPPAARIGNPGPVFKGDVEAFQQFSAAEVDTTAEDVDFDYDQAITVAKERVEDLIAAGAVESPEFVRALSQLAAAQQLATNYDASIQNYQAAVGAVEARGDRLSSDLVSPLWGLGRVYLEAGYGPLAIETYERALHIKKVNEGLHGADQSELLDEMGEAFLALGDTARALDMQEARVSLAERNYPGDDLGKLPALYDRARMLERVGKHIEATAKYRRIISLIERVEGSRSLELLPALSRISDVFLYNKMIDGLQGADQAKRYVRRAVYLVKKNPDATPTQKADAYLAMGDYLSLKSNNRHLALRYYRDAWGFLTEAGLEAERSERFARPVPINDVPDNSTMAFRALVGSVSDPVGRDGIVELAYDVTERGAADNVRVVHSEPSDYRDAVVSYHLSRVLFRPAFADGEPVVSSDNRYRVAFKYRESELPAGVDDQLASSDTASVQ